MTKTYAPMTGKYTAEQIIVALETNQPLGLLAYTVTARRSPKHAAITVQFNDRPGIGETFYHGGTVLTVIEVKRNDTGNVFN